MNLKKVKQIVVAVIHKKIISKICVNEFDI